MNRIFSVIFLILTVVIDPNSAQAQSLSLSLQDAVDIALENNFNIQIISEDRKIAQTDLDRYEAGYDPQINGLIGYRDDQSEQSSTVFGTKNTDADYNLSVSQRFDTGTTVTGEWTNNRSSSNSIFATNPTTHESTLGVTVQQSLAKNKFGFLDQKQSEITQINIEKAAYLLDDQVEVVVEQVHRAYWNLVWQESKVLIQRDILKQADDLLQDQKRKMNDRLTEEPDLLAAEANYAFHESQLELLINEKIIHENLLRQLLRLRSPDSFTLSQSLKSLSDLPTIDQSWTAALAQRKDYLQTKKDLEARNITIEMTENSLWPEIDLKASLARNGINDAFDDAIREVIEEDNRNFFIGLEFSFPWGRREAKVDRDVAEYEKTKSILKMKKLEYDIRIDVQNALQNVKTYQAYADKSVRVAEIQKAKLEAERKRFENGRSTTDVLIRFQEDVIRSRERALQAQYQYQLAVVDLKRATGNILGIFNNK